MRCEANATESLIEPWPDASAHRQIRAHSAACPDVLPLPTVARVRDGSGVGGLLASCDALMTLRVRSGILGEERGTNVATMRLGLAAMLCGVPLVACSLGSPTSESEPRKVTTTSVPVPTRASDRPSDAAAPPWADARDLRVRAAGYKGKKCFGDVPTLVGTPGDDRIRATSGDDVITLGGDDVIVGPKDAELMGSYCTGTGDDQVFYYQAKYITRSDGSIDFTTIGLGPGDDRVTALIRRSDFEQSMPGPGTTRSSWGPRVRPHVYPGPGDDLIRRPDSLGSQRTPCIDLSKASGPVRIDLARGRATGQGHDRFTPNIRCAVGGRFDDVLLGTPSNDELDARIRRGPSACRSR